jgi:hypothetical protein
MPLRAGIRAAGVKPPPEAPQAEKKNYAERLSNESALAVAGALRALGLTSCQPERTRGRERQFAGGIGAKKVDVSFATEEDGLVLGVSIKSISFLTEERTTIKRTSQTGVATSWLKPRRFISGFRMPSWAGCFCLPRARRLMALLGDHRHS